MAHPSGPVAGYPASSNAFPPPHPPPLHPNPYFYRPPLISRSAFRCLIAGMVLLFVAVALILFTTWLVLRPRPPHFQIDSLQLSNLSLASQSLSATWVVGFSVYNPNNKMVVSYDDVVSSIYYQSEYLSLTRIPPFEQGKGNRTSLTASFSLSNSYVDEWVIAGIAGDRGRGSVNFNVKIVGHVWFRASCWRTRRRLLRLVCQGVAVGLSSSNSSGSGKLLGGSRECAWVGLLG